MLGSRAGQCSWSVGERDLRADEPAVEPETKPEPDTLDDAMLEEELEMLDAQVLRLAGRVERVTDHDEAGEACHRTGLVDVGGEHVGTRARRVHDERRQHRRLILDVHELAITDPAGLEAEINNLAGVVTNGIFAAQAAQLVLVATPSGVERF